MISNTQKVKILLVEDHPIAAFVNKQLIEQIGYKADHADNGEKAIAMSANNYDVIFMDIGLPDIDGIAATAEIRRRENKTQKRAYIIALTAYMLEEVQDKCLAVGMDVVATKPATMEHLQKLIQQSQRSRSKKKVKEAINA